MCLFIFLWDQHSWKNLKWEFSLEVCRNFFTVSYWHVKTKILSQSSTKAWGAVRDFGRANFGAKLVSLIPAAGLT
jgi:hypothetical protein